MGKLKHALRRLAKSPTSTAIALVTLALAIGVNTAVFSMMDGFLLRALPYPQPDRIAAIVVHTEVIHSGASKPGAGKVVSDENDSFDGSSWNLLNASLDGVTLASWGGSGGVNLRAAAGIRYVTGGRVSARYFDVLGVPLYIGRGFSAEEDRPHGPPVVVL